MNSFLIGILVIIFSAGLHKFIDILPYYLNFLFLFISIYFCSLFALAKIEFHSLKNSYFPLGLVFLFIPTLAAMYSESIYGFNKVLVGLSLPISLVILASQISQIRIKILSGILFALQALLVLAILFKVMDGTFLRRSDYYGLIGSITFGWLMGMGLIISCMLKKNILAIIFLLACFWSFSRGPLAAALIILCFIYKDYYSRKFFKFIFLLIILICIV